MHDRGLVHRDDAVLVGRLVAEIAVRADDVVVAAPLLEQDLGLAETVEHLVIQKLVSEAGIEVIAAPVLPRQPGLDEPDLRTNGCDTVSNFSAMNSRPMLERMNSEIPAIM